MVKILVTGGAGYIGSHVVKILGEKAFSVLVFDNLSKGYRDAVLHGDLVVGDLANRIFLQDRIRAFKPDAVMHFASFIEVGESLAEPIKYYQNNVSNTIELLHIMLENNIKKFIFSSSAAVYGIPSILPIPEDEPIKPINPYGQSKAMIERILEDASSAYGLKYISLRYFNAAGADSEGKIGERHNPESHLIPLILKSATGERDNFKIYGNDYPTPDGTCIRDYVHVDDLATAHVLALQHLLDGGGNDVFNCGYGHGYSVREVINATQKVIGMKIVAHETGRRLGDPPSLVADSSKLKKNLMWRPQFDSLEYIIKTAWQWEKKQM